MRRERLLDAFDAGVEGPLTLVTGPPGTGKTVLLSTWLDAREHAGTVGWFSLERGDSRPGRFWSGVLDAVAAAGEPGLAPLERLAMGGRGEFLPAFANAVAALPGPLVLILDDFHELRAPEVDEALDALLRHPPEKLRLVIASRADPGLSLHRLRLEGRLAEVRAADLAFTLEEAAELFALAGLELSSEQIASLHARTEGWVAGLRLAALSLQASGDADALVRTFEGDERSVADYLVEEVLERQPAQMRDFMLRTSVAELVSPELADALTRRRDGARTLERLERSGAFVSALDNRRAWYRYHPMFADLLRSELRHRTPEVFLLQHRRAARWYAASGLKVPATRHALAAGDWELAANLLSTGWLAALVRGESTELAELIRGLPRELVARSPELATAAAGALLESGELEQGREYLRLADDSASAVRRGRRAEQALGRTVAALYEARDCGELGLARRAAAKLLAGNGSKALALDGRDLRALGLLNRGAAEAWIGDPRRARSDLEDSLALARRSGRDYLVLSALAPLALLEALTGPLRRSARLAQEAVGLAERHGWTGRPPCAAAHVALAVCSYEWGSVSQARRHVDGEEAGGGVARERATAAIAEITRALVAARCGELERAELILRAARQDAIGWKMPAAIAVRLACAEGKVLAAAGRAPEAIEAVEGARRLGAWAELDLVAARLALAEGEPERAARLVAPALEGAVRVLQPSTGVELHALAAVAEHRLGADERALELVERALALAEPDGSREMLLELGAPLRELLVRRIRAGTAHRALAGDVVDALDPRSARGVGAAELLLEPLSAREEAVLRYLPTVMSKAEMAAEMYISVNTVKTHMRHIYRKLEVTSRAEAVRRARSLGLL